MIDYVLAFSAGLLSFLSPCVLPLIPLYFSHLIGTSVSRIDSGKVKLQLLVKSLFFTAGFSIVFILLGVSVGAISSLLSDYLDYIRRIGGVLIILFGLHMTGVFKFKFLYREKRWLSQGTGNKGGNASSLMLGMAFAVGWTPCIGPILSSILLYAGSMETVKQGVLLLVLYSLGFAVPIVLAAIFVGNLTGYIKKLSKYIPVISLISGLIMILIGVLVFTDKLEVFSKYGSLFNL
ncbi:cytochrome c biogenesis CcdA family protein [Paenibacillus koleovorans]|uniref:cytochrome c biogenesis CcdA family protein n=1 Tax=Paenibacillus koleovorans TaxID=121608 RepID=UPI001FE883A5|nr:cytochrome c biogenesis protein CcdA [Paenibacillus koleovorans]